MELLIAIFGSSAITATIMALFNRHKTAADTSQVTAETERTRSATMQTATAYYQQQVEETVKQMYALDAQVKELKAAIETARADYERRAGGLHTKMDVANDTIAQLRQEVKDGNIIITELRKEISSLLVKAEKNK